MFSSRVSAALTPDRVLVVYNSANADSLAVWQHYAASRPGVRGFDLADATLSPGTISYAEFITKIRQPLRAHLTANSLSQEVVVFVLTMGLPHRVRDINAGDLGDNAGAASSAITGGNASYCSVDSELTLLWQNLESGENNGNMDSGADNNVMNPYYGLYTPITDFSRAKITQAKYFSKVAGPRWKLLEKVNGSSATAGDIYLTARLDGNSRQAVLSMIDRGRNPSYDRETYHIIQDKSASNGTLDQNDYTSAYNQMSGVWPAFVNEQTDTFLIGMNGDLDAGNSGTQRFSGRVVVLSGYGGNHSGPSKAGFIRTFQGQIVPGAIYNQFESFNARKFGGVGGWGSHGQLSDWVDAGGTFGIGHAWEPLASAVSRNAVMLRSYFQEQRTWVEAAWSGVRYLSWQNVVIGDPLAVASFAPHQDPIEDGPGDEPGEGDEPGGEGSGEEQAPELPWVRMISEGGLAEGSGEPVVVRIELDKSAAEELRVGLSFSGDAVFGEDYEVLGLTEGVAVVPAGETGIDLVIRALEDDLPEGDEWIHVTLLPDEGYEQADDVLMIRIEDRPYDAWRHQTFAPEPTDPLSDPFADPDQDGLCNLLEYAMGLDPLKPCDEGAPTFALEDGENGKVAVYRFQQSEGATCVVCCVEWSDDLKTWHSTTAEKVGEGGGLRFYEARLPLALSGSAYFRLAVKPSAE